jgi:cell fate regulator YaaT (PSP1 superfamily)
MLNDNSCSAATTNPIRTAARLYEVEINPFRLEYVTAKSASDQPQYNLYDHIVIQYYKENLLGQIINIKDIPELDRASRCQILRLANESDFNRKKTLLKQTADTGQFFEDLFKQFKLTAKVVFIDFDLNHYKTYCYMISERKINYLLLHETAVDSLKTRVAIKQVGVRDYARCIGGIGICGREQCCSRFLKNIQSITLTMVRHHNIFTEPEKITGNCGKLRCCLMYEQLSKGNQL